MTDKLPVTEGQHWQLDKQDGYTIKIMAVREGYAMVRRKGRIPFVITISDLQKKYRLNPFKVKKT